MNGESYTKVFLFRHTQTINTLDGTFRYNGFIDVDVDSNGLKVLYKYIPFLKNANIKAIYCSDLIRAKKGAEIFSNALKLPLIETTDLREVKQGRWEGLSYNEIMEKFPEEAKKKFSDYVNFKVKVADGKVIFSGKEKGYGNIVILKHKNDIYTIYSNLDKVSSVLSMGKKLKRGDNIGIVNDLLIIQSTKGKKYIDPEEFIE